MAVHEVHERKIVTRHLPVKTPVKSDYWAVVSITALQRPLYALSKTTKSLEKNALSLSVPTYSDRPQCGVHGVFTCSQHTAATRVYRKASVKASPRTPARVPKGPSGCSRSASGPSQTRPIWRPTAAAVVVDDVNNQLALGRGGGSTSSRRDGHT